MVHTLLGRWNMQCFQNLTSKVSKEPCQLIFNVDQKTILMAKTNTVVTVLSFSHVWLFATPCTAASQASLSFTISWSLLKLIFFELVMLSNFFILCRPLLLLPSVFPSISLSRLIFYWLSPLHQVTKVLELQFQQIDLFSTPSSLINFHQILSFPIFPSFFQGKDSVTLTI